MIWTITIIYRLTGLTCLKKLFKSCFIIVCITEKVNSSEYCFEKTLTLNCILTNFLEAKGNTLKVKTTKTPPTCIYTIACCMTQLFVLQLVWVCAVKLYFFLSQLLQRNPKDFLKKLRRFIIVIIKIFELLLSCECFFNCSFDLFPPSFLLWMMSQ